VPESVRRALAGPATPLPLAVGPGKDFTGVRVHTDPSAAELGAEAYTVGEHIVFAPGRLEPGTERGRRLLRHELAHVAQQRGSASSPMGALTVGALDDAAEREAEAVAHGRRDRVGVREPREVLRRQVEPHYPTEDEQREIERLLGRAFVSPAQGIAGGPAAQPAGAQATGAPVQAPAAPPPVRGKVLTDAEVHTMARALAGPVLKQVMAGIDDPASAVATDPDAAFGEVAKARDTIYARYGQYITRTITLTRDPRISLAERRKANQVLVTFEDTGDQGPGLVRTTMSEEVFKAALAGLAERSQGAVVDEVVATIQREHPDDLRRAARVKIGGDYVPGTDIANLPLRPGVYETAIHELLHAVTHPAFRAAFSQGNERDIREGFTDYFTRELVDAHSAYDKFAAKIGSIKSAIHGPFLLTGDASAEESLRQAFFRGRLDLIGWTATSPEELAAVTAAGGSAEWKPELAKVYADKYRAQALAAQDPHRNQLGIGLFFGAQRGGDPSIAVRCARVIARTEPYARGQFLLEGRVLGSPVTDPKALGASVGVAAEYQEPYFYATAGARFVGTAVSGGPERFDASGFVGAGVRAWQPIRVGAEGFVLQPLLGGERAYGAGVTVGIEFK
jgi:hypothetical protein